MRSLFLLSLATCLGCAAVALAQQTDQPNRPRESNPPAADSPEARGGHAARGHGAQADQQLRELIAIGNEAEIQLAQFAQQRASSDEVKQFAQNMIEEHQHFLQQVRGNQREGTDANTSRPRQAGQATDRNEASAGANTNPRNESGAADGDNRPSARDNQASAATGQPGRNSAAGELDLVQLKREISQQCLQETQRLLAEKSGAEFDKCYIGSQVGAHIEMLAMLQVFERHASSELAQQIQQGIATTRQHLQHAEKLAATLEQQGDRRNVSQRNERDRSERERTAREE